MRLIRRLWQQVTSRHQPEAENAEVQCGDPNHQAYPVLKTRRGEMSQADTSEVLSVSADGVEYSFTLEFATDVKRLIGQDARAGKFSWETAAKLTKQIVSHELGLGDIRGQDSRVVVRWANEDDLLGVEVVSLTSNIDGWDAAKFRQMKMQQGVMLKVAELDGEILGYMMYELARNRLILIDLAVHPGLRRLRIGATLVGWLIRKLSENRRRSLDVIVRDDNLDAQLFFQAMGFEANSKIKRNYFANGVDGYFLQRWFNYIQ